MFVLPDRIARLQLIADDQLLVLTLFLGDGVLTGDSERRPAEANALTPQLFGRLIIPVADQGDSVNDAVVVAPQELWIICVLRGGQLNVRSTLNAQVRERCFVAFHPDPAQTRDSRAADSTIQL